MSRTRRRRRRGARGSRGTIVAALIAALVVVVAVILIVRGDTTPRPAHAANHRHVHVATAAAAPGLPNTPAAPQTEAIASAASTPASQPPHQATPQPASTGPTGAPRLAIIIDDCGQWLDTERGFIALPVPLTLSVLPHVRYGTQIAREAADAGKGVMLHLPMEPDSGADPGPGRVTTAMDDAAIVAQVRDDLDAVPLAAGVNNHEGSRASSDDRVMRDVASVLAERHVFFVDSRTSAATVAERDASAAGVPTARRNVFLDDVADVDATQAQLRRAAALAKANGSAIAIGHPRPTTLTAVRSLLPELEREGITLVLASDLVR
jgi:polysaccharide deacetylase 2 family uncharacterized protein YibQ